MQVAKKNTFILDAKFSQIQKEEIYSCLPRSKEMDDISYDKYTAL